MKTIEIIHQLIHTAENNPSSLYQIPWEDLKLCFITELDCRKELYPDNQFQAIQQLIQTKFLALDQYLSLFNTTAITNILHELILILQILPDGEYTDTFLQELHYNEACLQHHLNDTIIVLGDSHVNFFSGNENLTFIPIGNDINLCPTTTSFPFTVLHLGPCLAYNCNKANTSTLFQEKVEFLCYNFIKPNAHIICALGEIDLRVHVLRQANLQQRSYQEIVDDILKEYMHFLLMLKANGFRISCWGPIASQPDICPVDPEFPRIGSETERNMATAYFNRQLSLLCKQHGIGFLSIFDQMITGDFQTIETYLSNDHCHLSQRALELTEPLLMQLGNLL